MALTKVTYSMIDSAPVNIMDWIPAQYHAAIKDFSSTVPVQSYIQAAMDSGAGSIYFPMGYYVIASPLYVTNGVSGSNQAANLTFVGENRTSTYFAGPGASSFTPSGTGIRAMIINRSDNGKFSLKNLRFQGDIGQGYVLYALENGTTSQCIFSGVIEDCWFSLSSTNAGIFYGGMQNFVVANNTFEQAKGCFYLVGAGCGDIHFSNNSLYACYDSFLDGTIDNAVKTLITVQGLNVYGHLRGPVFAANNAQNWHIVDVNFQGDTVGTLGTLGLTNFIDCQSITIDGFSCYDALNDVVKVSGSSMKISNGFIAASDSGIYVTSNNSVNLTIDNVDIKESNFGAFYHPSGNPGGTIKVSNCAWYNTKGDMWLDQSGSATYSVTFENCRFTNAGYPNTAAGSRNFDIATSGNVNFYDCLIGRTTTDAIANYYINANGTGDLVLTNCTLTPTAAPGVPEITGSQVVKIAGGLGNRYRQYYKSAAPTTGTWNVGDRVFNSAPAVGQPKGWICTVAGTPGTWVSEGNL
jgi:hypothetical protein